VSNHPERFGCRLVSLDRGRRGVFLFLLREPLRHSLLQCVVATTRRGESSGIVDVIYVDSVLNVIEIENSIVRLSDDKNMLVACLFGSTDYRTPGTNHFTTDIVTK
jgi:hypothetical protein